MIISMFQMHAMRAIFENLAKNLTHRSILGKFHSLTQYPGLMPRGRIPHVLLRLERHMLRISLEAEYCVFLLRNSSSYPEQ